MVLLSDKCFLTQNVNWPLESEKEVDVKRIRIVTRLQREGEDHVAERVHYLSLF